MSEQTGRIFYHIRVRGRLGQEWASWFENLTLTQEAGGYAVLEGPISDQAALRGILSKIWDLNLQVVAVNVIAEHAGDENHDELRANF
jgi:hypothetical protein